MNESETEEVCLWEPGRNNDYRVVRERDKDEEEEKHVEDEDDEVSGWERTEAEEERHKSGGMKGAGAKNVKSVHK